MSTDMDTAGTTDRRKRGRGVVVLKFGLAGAALLGIAAAATSAAWTDNAWFSANASGATIELQGSLDTSPLVWDLADTKGTALAIPSPTFADLVPGESRTYVVHVQNTGSTTLSIAAPTWIPDTTNDALFSGTEPVTVTLSQTTAFTLVKDGTQDVTVTVAAPKWSDADTTYQGANGAGWIQFAGTVGS